MNILMLSLLYPRDEMDNAALYAKDKIQNQINNYQYAFIEGIQTNLLPDETLQIVNSLPVGIFPLQYRKLFLQKGLHDNGSIFELGAINLPWFKQKCRKIGAIKAIREWVKADKHNRTILLYTQYLPYVEAVLKVKKEFPDLRAAVIVTDLPNEFGLPSGRTGLMKQIEYCLGKKSMSLCRLLDGFILLTEPMAEALRVQDKPYTVIEGLILERSVPEESFAQKPAVLYTGTLEPDLGIADLLEAFQQLPECELWICGQGSMRFEVEKAAQRFENIRYFGFVPQKEALALQAKATALINPRSPEGAFTRYSFPSKTLEYLRSGKPVLCYQLEGIPSDYDDYLQYIPKRGAEGIVSAVKTLLSLSPEERKARGEAGRQYVLTQKNPAVQCAKLLTFLRRL